MSNSLGYIGKTVASVEDQEWAGTDTFKDTVTWNRVVITFTDGTTTSFDSWDGEVYDPYRCVFDDDGQPQELVVETDACRHCGHGIGKSRSGLWVAPDAGFDVEGGDGMWREICPDRDDFPNPEHEPDESSDDLDWPEEVPHDYDAYDSPEALHQHLMHAHGYIPESANFLLEQGMDRMLLMHNQLHHDQIARAKEN